MKINLAVDEITAMIMIIVTDRVMMTDDTVNAIRIMGVGNNHNNSDESLMI